MRSRFFAISAPLAMLFRGSLAILSSCHVQARALLPGEAGSYMIHIGIAKCTQLLHRGGQTYR
ncbi:exported hypothetical protein [Mesorhizobium metallidurans STM 2683]|uniref:Lipoprotein n=1 Tax=Mesorhizobium metallidurans STM 2683 TaxID=1297569 RepID=M5EI04_9HYPH|nr:exported hypothetical protein [Mesorhizobium metallidurans STM 2683]